MRRVHRGGLALVALLGTAPSAAGVLHAQAPRTAARTSAPATPRVTRARVWLVPKADSVFVFLVDPPGAGGAAITRVRAGAAPETLRVEPLRRERDPERLVARLGTDLALVQRTVGAADDVELVRRLTSDPFFGTVASALHRNVALAMGRLHVDTTVAPGAEYEYHVAWLRADGSGDPRHPPVVARVRVADAPLPAPAALEVTGRDERAVVTWRYPRYTGDAKDHVIAFAVERADAGGAFRRVSATPVLRNDAAARLSFADSGLRTGVRTRYRVRAVDVAGREGAPSTEAAVVTRDLTPPASPAGLALEAGDARVTVRWTQGTERDLAGYWVERSLALDRPYTRLTRTPLPPAMPAFVDSAVTGPWQHFYRVVAVDSAGNESRPSTARDASPTDRRPPPTPASLTATVVRRRAALRWPAAAARDLLGYYVYRGATTAQMVRLTAKPISATQFVDSGFEAKGLAPGARYVVGVSAVDQSFNESERRTTEVAIPDDDPPRAPASVRALNAAGRAVELTWSASPSRDAVAYAVSRVGPDGTALPLGRVVAGRVLALRDTADLVRGRWYRYRVIAEDAAGNRSVAAVDSARVADPVPPSPTRHASASLVAGGGVSLRWEPVVDDELAGFHVYRAAVPTGVGERLTTAPLRGTSFVDRAGRADHWYVVTAVDRSGNESARSDAVRPEPRAVPAPPASRASGRATGGRAGGRAAAPPDRGGRPEPTPLTMPGRRRDTGTR